LKHHYPKPGDTGGKLIRQVIGFLKGQGVALPLDTKDSHILIAVSGGSDSMALAHLVARYGRKVADRSKIRLLHINHGWRGAESDGDEAFVRERAKAWGVKLTVRRLKPLPYTAGSKAGESLELLAREARKKIFAKECKAGTVLLTAHQADDLAETLLWRLFTGSSKTHGGGILAKHGHEVRPFLTARKATLQQYLREEGESWREDRTNHEGRFLRSQMRAQLMPLIEKLFPRAVEHLVRLALHAQDSNHLSYDEGGLFQAVLGARASLGASGRIQRVHAEQLSKDGRQIDLPGGWRLTRTLGKRPKESWLLEKL